MDDLERSLRDVLTDERLDIPIRLGAVTAVHDGVRRRVRRRAVVTTSATAAAVVIGVSTAVIAGGAGDRASVVPGGEDRTPTASASVPAPSTPPSPVEAPIAGAAIAWNPLPFAAGSFTVPGTVPDPSVPWCTTKQLTLTAGEFQGATGSAAGELTIHDNGAACGLQGPPAVTGYDTGNRVVAIPALADDFTLRPWFVLRSGQQANASLQIFGDGSRCLGPVKRLSVDLGRGGPPAPVAIGSVGGGDVRPRCGTAAAGQQTDHYTASAGNWLRPDGTPSLPPSTLGVTVAHAPRIVMQGAILRFQIVLSGVAPGDPCRPFREGLVAADASHALLAQEDHLLDCKQIGAAGHAKSYVLDMELAVPAGASPGNAQLSWETPLPGETADNAPTIRIVAAPPACTQKQLGFRAGRSGVGLGNYRQDIVISNVSTVACSLRGYPGVEFVDSAGHGLRTEPHHGSSYFWGLDEYETILVPPGSDASFGLAGSDYDSNHQRACPEAAGIKVIAPGLATQVLVGVQWPDCYRGRVDVSPVVPGHRGPS